MQSLLFLKPADDAEIDRVINIDLMSTAYANPEGGTIAICGNAEIRMSLPFPEFVKKVEFLIAENYRTAHESSIKWHQKRMDDLESVMKDVMKDHTH